MNMNLIICFVLIGIIASVISLRGNDINAAMAAPQSEGRIFQGQNATEGQFPYMVGILVSVLARHRWCGGSIISKEWVLTAAHCVRNARKIKIYLGATTNRTSADVEYMISKEDLVVHPHYNSKTEENDISLIKIPSTILSPKIQPVKLPDNENSHSKYLHEMAVISGWGHTNVSQHGPVNNLQWTDMIVITNDICSRIYPRRIKSSNICTSIDSNASGCKGDSGGPLVLRSSNVQIGIISSTSNKGCDKGYPNIFVRVTSFLEWINRVTGLSEA